MILSRKEKEELYLAYRLREQRQSQKQPLTVEIAYQSSKFRFRGNNAVIQSWTNPPRPAEFILEGGAETGKTYAALNLLNQLAWHYPNARLAIIRQYHVDLVSTVLDIYKREFIAGDVQVFGGESPLFYQYPNGTRVWTFGMDRSQRVLSGAFDAIYFNQVEETQSATWETLSTRVTGRAGAIVPGLLFGDMNPAALAHWIYAREAAGNIQILSTTHKDNPSLYDDQGQPTRQGNETISRLSNLTGVLRARLYEGKRASAAGLVYGEVWDDQDGSITEAAEYVPNGGTIYWASDDGYSAGSAPHQRAEIPERGIL